MPFVKLDCNILNSSLWIDHDARELFVTALLMARPILLDAPAQGIAIKKIEPLGFTVPPGEYGFVAAASTGIIHQAGIPRDRGLEALARLSDQDSDSRTPDHEGRRMVRVDGGFVILNYMKYRELDRTNAERQARFRQKHKAEEGKKVTAVTPLQPLLVTQAEAEAVIAKAIISDKPKGLSSPVPAKPGTGKEVKKIVGKDLLALFHETCPTLPRVHKLTPERKKHVAARARAAEGNPLEWFRTLFQKAAASDFLSGKAGTFKASFDWLLSPSNAQKTLEGNFDNEHRQTPATPRNGRNHRTANPAADNPDKFSGWGTTPPAS